MEAFRIEVADGQQGKFFDIKVLGNGNYQIFDEQQEVCTIALNEDGALAEHENHAVIDRELLAAIAERIQFHEQVHPRG